MMVGLQFIMPQKRVIWTLFGILLKKQEQIQTRQIMMVLRHSAPPSDTITPPLLNTSVPSGLKIHTPSTTTLLLQLHYTIFYYFFAVMHIVLVYLFLLSFGSGGAELKGSNTFKNDGISIIKCMDCTIGNPRIKRCAISDNLFS